MDFSLSSASHKIGRPLLFVLLLQFLSSSSSTTTNLRGRRVQGPTPLFSNEIENKNPSTLLCRITIFETIWELPEASTNIADGTDSDHSTKFASIEETYCIPLSENYEDSHSDDPKPIRLPSDFSQLYASAISSGTLLISVTGAEMVVDKSSSTEIIMALNASLTVLSNSLERKRRLTSKSLGPKTVMVVRISTLDSQPEHSLQSIETALFGGDGYSLPTFKSQYENCSAGKVTFQQVGGHDILINANVSSFTSGSALVSKATEQLKQIAGVAYAGNIADFVIFCAPNGAGKWVATAGVNWWSSQYNSPYCMSLGAVMHETGHNMGLMHASQGKSQYGDLSGYMGSENRRQGAPQKCFNAGDNHLLGWYSDREEFVNPSEGKRIIKLASFVDYEKAQEDEPVLININNTLFVQYNLAKEFNAETEEFGNKVTINSFDEKGYTYVEGALSVGKKISLEGFHESEPLVIEVCDRVDASTVDENAADVMIISVAFGKTLCRNYLKTLNKLPPKKKPKNKRKKKGKKRGKML